jgi:hypothetical protein
MSSQLDFEEMESDIQELLEAEETSPETFYLALKNALEQLEQHAATTYA